MTNQTATTRAAAHAQQYRATWRWHFFAGVFVVPFLLVLATTGLVMLYYTTVATPLGERLVVEVQEHTPTSPVQQVAAAVTALPGMTATQYIPAATATSTAQVELIQGDGVYVADINPYSDEILRVVDKNDTLYALAKRIHSSLLAGDAGEILVEIVAGLAFLLLATGPYMWLRKRQLAQPQSAPGRNHWRRWHLLIGLYSAVVLCFFLLSGLAWTGVWGGKLVQPWGSFPAERWGPVTLSDTTHSAMNHGATKEVPWGLEQTPVPASTAHAQHAHSADQSDVNLNTVNILARDIGFGPRYRINLPRSADGVYTISKTSMTGDIDVSGDERTVHIDRHSGEIVAEAGFDDYSLLAKSMAVGVGVHQATMGWWNIAMNVLACLAVIFLCVSGTLLWWLRRGTGSRWLPAAPRKAELPLHSGLTVLLVALGLAFPLLGATLVVALLSYAALERARQ